MDKVNSAKEMGSIYAGVLMFYVPVLYAIRTRFLKRTKLGIFFWLAEYLFPVLLSFLLANIEPISISQMLLSVVCVYCFYEIGYIQNDCETIKKEENPTLRLSEDELKIYERNKWNIYMTRGVLGILFSMYYIQQGIPSCILLPVLWGIIPLYLLYNSMRNRLNQYLVLFLMVYRYGVPFFLYTHFNWNCYLLLLIIISYPIPTFIQICAKEKRGRCEKWALFFVGSYNKRELFRLKFYLLLIVGVGVLAFLNQVHLYYVILPIYFFLFRIGSYSMRKIL